MTDEIITITIIRRPGQLTRVTVEKPGRIAINHVANMARALRWVTRWLRGEY